MNNVSEDEKVEFYKRLKEIMPNSAILTALEHLPQPVTGSQTAVRKLPMLLTSLYHSEYETMEKDDLMSFCHKVFESQLVVTKAEAEYLEEQTKLQQQSPMWFQHRTGRITASVFGKVAKARLNPPPFSLVKRLVNRNTNACTRISSVPQIQWGNVHESVARDAYLLLAKTKHECLEYTSSGLHVKPSWPHLGASPDGLISCKCCGNGLIEIKYLSACRPKHSCRQEVLPSIK